MPYKNKEDLYVAQKRFRDKRKKALTDIKKLKDENDDLKKELQIYRKLFGEINSEVI